MSFHKVQCVVDNWVVCRKKTVASLRSCANQLEKSHRNNAKAEHESAKASVAGDFIGLSGVLLAPFSGGLSLGLCGLSAVTSVGSYFNKRQANQDDDKVKNRVESEFKRSLDDDDKATAKLTELNESLTYLEEQLEVKMIGDTLVFIQEKSLTNFNINVGNVHRNNVEDQLQSGNDINVSVLGITKHVANLKAALTSAEQVAQCTRITKDVIKGTRTIKQVVSTAKSINDISKAAQSLATAKQTAVLSIQAGQSVAKSATAFASVARGTDGVAKTVGAVASVSLTSKRTADLINASGTIASAAKTVTKTARAGKSISTLTKGADTTIKTVRNVKQASQTVKTVTQVARDSDKALRTTRLATQATKVTKVTQTATKAASISKFGLAINVVVIPLDVYSLVVASDNLEKSHEDVKRINDEADGLERQLKDMSEGIRVQIETFIQLHVQLCEVYKKHYIRVIYDYLQIMHEQLEFPLP